VRDYPVRGLVGNANDKTVVELDNGTIISVAEYFNKTYGKKVHCSISSSL
jgi:hypothetical protein